MLSEPLPLDDALRIAAATRVGRLRPIALEIDRTESGWVVAVRFEGRPQTVELGLASAHTVAAWRETLVDDESTSWWRAYVDRQSLESGDDVLIRCGVEPKAHAALVTQTLDALAGLGVTPTLCAISPGLGSVTLRYDGGANLDQVQAALLGIAETVTILTAPAASEADRRCLGHAAGDDLGYAGAEGRIRSRECPQPRAVRRPDLIRTRRR